MEVSQSENAQEPIILSRGTHSRLDFCLRQLVVKRVPGWGHSFCWQPSSQIVSVPLTPDGSGEGGTGLFGTVPEGRLSEQPSSQMRKAQYHVLGETGDAECMVFYFGPGQDGDARITENAYLERRASTKLLI